MKRLAIIGAGDLGRLILNHSADSNYKCVAFFDDTAIGQIIDGVEVTGGVNSVSLAYEKGFFDVLIIGIGYRHFDFRRSIFEKHLGVIPFANIIHSSSYVDPSVKLGEGIFILPGCTLDHQAEVANNVLINVGCIIAHDTKIGAHSFLSPGVALAGFIEVGEVCNLGIGTIVIDNVKMANSVQTGAGAVVTKNLEEPGLYLGVPAIKKR